MARQSPGTALSSSELDDIVIDKVLIDWPKHQPENCKTASELLTVDTVGLLFPSPIGVYENMAEIDFAVADFDSQA